MKKILTLTLCLALLLGLFSGCGTIVAYTTAGDGFDSNGNLTISGGNVTVWSGGNADNQPLDADGTIAITGGSAGMGMNLSF